MKRYNVYSIVFTVCLLAAISCSKDLGNYDYHAINELAIKGISADYSLMTAVDTLRIEPEVSATEADADANRYDYFWIVSGNDRFLDTVSKERLLNYPVGLIPGPYNLRFRMVDKVTDVAWWFDSKLTVGTPYSRGILLVGEDEQGQAEADMLSMVNDTIHVGGILSRSGLPPLTGPVNFLHTGGWDAYMKLWVFTKSGSYYLDRATMQGTAQNRFANLVYTTDPIQIANLDPVVLAPQIRNAAGAIGADYMRAMLCSDGSIFTSFLLLNGGDFYTNPMNRTSDKPETLLKAAPYLLYSIGNMNSVMWYDTENNRFLNISNIGLSTTSDILKDAADDPFPWNQTDRTLVYAENTQNTDGGAVNGNSFAIMKDAGNAHYLYKFYAYGSAPVKRAQYKVLPIAVDFDKANFYAFSSNRTVVFYSVGAKLYAYDYNPGNEKFYQITNTGQDGITMLKFDTQIDYSTNSLYIATYNTTTKGTLRRYIVGSNPNTVQITPAENAEWSGLIKVTNMNWRAVN